MPERRYSDEEVRRIIALAAEADASGDDAARPWSLADVEQIGTEAGLSRHALATAALTIDRQPAEVAAERYLGLPVAVSRAVPLGRGLSDDDWNELVARLRDTFSAEGRTHVEGARREWRVGNLRVTHEPAGDGALLRLRTRKGDARVFFQLAAVLLMIAITATVIAHADPGPAPDARRLAVAWMAGFGATVMIVVGALRIPAWAQRRARQFDSLAAFARRISAS